MTLLSDEFLFIHVPRTGGSSINQALRSAFDYTELPRHHTFAEMRQHRHGRFSFGFVRNPWDRCVSMHLGSAAHTHYSDYYTDETRYMVETICKKDIDAFGYTF